MCSDAKCPVSSATSEDRRNRADIAASFQVEISWFQTANSQNGFVLNMSGLNKPASSCLASGGKV